MKLIFFLWLNILRANHLIYSFGLVPVWHAQLCLDQSDSKILETSITQGKCESLKCYFAYSYTSKGVTNQFSFFKAMPRHAPSTSRKYFKDLRYRDVTAYGYGSTEAINWFSFIKWVSSTTPRQAYSALK